MSNTQVKTKDVTGIVIDCEMLDPHEKVEIQSIGKD